MVDVLQHKNLAATVDPAQVRAFDSAEQHLREELWRIWLRVEHETRRRWELQALPTSQHEGSLGTWQPREIDGLFRQARGEYAGAARGARDGRGSSPDGSAAEGQRGVIDHGSRETLDAYLRHSALLELRIEKTVAAGRELPLLELVRTFALDARQRMTLTLALAGELDAGLMVALRYLANDPMLRHIDGRLLSILVYDSIRARSRLARDLSPGSPLVFHRLIDVEDAAGTRQSSILHRRIRPAPRLLPYLEAGDRELDPELEAFARVLALDAPGLFPDEQVDVCASALRDQPVLLVVAGQHGIGKRTLLATAAQRWGSRVLALDAAALGKQANLSGALHAIVRELKLLDAVPAIVDLEAATQSGPSTEIPPFVAQLCELWPGPIAVTLTGERLPPLRLRPIVHVQVPTPRLETRVQLWQRALPDIDEGDASELAERFAVNGGVIEMAAQAARVTSGSDQPPVDVVDQAVRGQLYGRLSRLGKQLDAPYGFDDIVADNDSKAALTEIIAAIRERRRVREEWGFRGAAGISVLFSGSPGVGKTMSATVIARELSLAIYEIDLSQVMSKWVGETEKNLSEIFDAAEPGHIVLLFNEADALFGKRTTDASSANDRFANLEVNYLLQRLERFNGLSILTTNLTKSIDAAFRRRFAYDVQFAFPSADLRAQLWRRAFPKKAHTQGLDYDELAERYEMSGGYIKVAAERAAFIAAGRHQPIQMPILIDTIERMYRERGKLSPVGKLE